LEDVIIQDVKMMEHRSKYIDYYDDSDYENSDDDEYDCENPVVVEKKNITNTPKLIEMLHDNESTSAFTMHDTIAKFDIEKGDINIKTGECDMESSDTDNEPSLTKQVQIIKEIINDKKYLNNDIENEIKKKDEMEKYLKNEYDKNINDDIDNEWVNIQVFE